MIFLHHLDPVWGSWSSQKTFAVGNMWWILTVGCWSMCADCRESSWPLSVIVNSGEMGWWEKICICGRWGGESVWGVWEGTNITGMVWWMSRWISLTTAESSPASWAGNGTELPNAATFLWEPWLCWDSCSNFSAGCPRLLCVVSAHLPPKPGLWALPTADGTSGASLGPLLEHSGCSWRFFFSSSSGFVPTGVCCVLWGGTQHFASWCHPWALPGALGEGQHLVPLSAPKALKCHHLAEPIEAKLFPQKEKILGEK